MIIVIIIIIPFLKMRDRSLLDFQIKTVHQIMARIPIQVLIKKKMYLSARRFCSSYWILWKEKGNEKKKSGNIVTLPESEKNMKHESERDINPNLLFWKKSEKLGKETKEREIGRRKDPSIQLCNRKQLKQ